ncbi:hypothetical protein R50345_06600 [Paenibacillus sp. FSL R5-0345]|nr:hypothetical protein R50345_06600 [Paenibacillus sp. FSL R5-0345]
MNLVRPLPSIAAGAILWRLRRVMLIRVMLIPSGLNRTARWLLWVIMNRVNAMYTAGKASNYQEISFQNY